MNDWKRGPLAAVVLIVVLRLSIGWQFLYEGLWKHDQLNTPTPWSAEGYLKAAQGPFRDTFRNMTGDPDDLGWLDDAQVLQRWTKWRDTFVAHYGLNEKQTAELDGMLNGPAAYVAPLAALPAGLDLNNVVSGKLKGGPKLTYDAGRKALVLDSTTPLVPAEVSTLLAESGLVKNPAGELVSAQEGGAVSPEAAAYYRAIESLERQSAKLPFRSRLLALTKGDPDRVGVFGLESGKYAPVMGSAPSDEKSATLLKYGEVQVYKDMLAEYAAAEKKAKTDFQLKHMETLWGKIQAKKSELVGPVKALDKSLKEDAFKLLTREQIARGAAPREVTPVTQASDRAMWALLIFGTLLLVGLGTRVAAIGGACLLMSFYLVVPPWPGVPQPPSTEHSFIVNKNLIEAIALLGIAAMPTGSWFGLDGVIRWLISGRKRAAAK